MKFFRTKELPSENTLVIQELKNLEIKFSDLIYFKNIFDKVKNEYERPESKNNIDHCFKKLKMTPLQVALYSLAGTSRHLISSGQFHINRGALNVEGTDFKNIFIRATQMLADTGYFTNQEKTQELADFDNLIAEWG